MLKDILRTLSTLGESPPTIDASRFGDPLALKTQWTPAKGGGANFRTHRLIEVDATRMEFRASLGAKIFYTTFMVMGIGTIVVFVFARSTMETPLLGTELLIPMFIGGLFAAAGVFMLHFGTAPIVFDKLSGYFWRGRKSPQDVADVRSLKHAAELSQIHALQLLAEYVRGNKSSYYSYELNLVLKDGSRINVIDHGNQTRLREDAKALSAFLGKPVWDATSGSS